MASNAQAAPVPPYLTTLNGAPLESPNASQRIGNQLRATLLLQDINLLEVIQHLTHERIPERVVHARGAGAMGYFEVTKDITEFTSAAFLNKVGKRTSLLSRFSTTAGEAGSAETVRDTRGFAFKLYTEEGNLDWMFLSTPVFSIRDGAKFPSFVHAGKRNPQTGLHDSTMLWDFFSKNQEVNHFLMFLFSDRGTAKGWQSSDIFSVNTYRFTKPDGSFVFVKIHMKPEGGVKNFTREMAQKKAGVDPDFQTRTLISDIESKKFPAWKVFAQIVTPQEAETLDINIFDDTKTLPQSRFPLREFGRIVLDKNVDNMFAQTEQAAFSPTNIVPGWGLTPDPILQTRALAYPDTQRYRLGVNFIQLPVNRPNFSFNPILRDGACAVNNYGNTPNYFPSSFLNLGKPPQVPQIDHEMFQGTVTSFESHVVDADFTQARVFFEQTLAKEPGQQENLVQNIANSLFTADAGVQTRTFAMFDRVSADLGMRVRKATAALIAAAKMSAMTEDEEPMHTLTNGTSKMKLANGTSHNTGMFAHKKWVTAAV